ncbi:MAG: OmpA family protein [Deltaproteobacteria bacterium]|nr:OmpA family protein [Deltaproteobacteria bacterium]
MGVTGRLVVSLASVLAAAPALAEGLDAERFVPAISGEGGFVNEHPAVPFHLGWSLGLFVNVADDPVVVDGTALRPVDTAVSADLVGSLGLFGRLELGLHLPVHLLYDGDPYASGGTTLAASAGLGDLRFVPKVVLVRSGDLESHVLLGLAAPVSVPTGDEAAFRGAGGVTVEPKLLFAAHLGKLGLGFDVGYRWRAEHPVALPWGDEITLGPWLSYALTDALTGRLEVYGGKQVGSDVDGADFPLELLGGVDHRFGDLAVYGGAALGVIDGIGAPDFRFVAGVRYRQGVAERQGFADTDGDGLVDKDDDCHREAEDVDGFRDGDGCPEPDNDGDGIADGDDECPELSGEADRRGCPSRTFVNIEDGKMIIIGKVQFRSGSAEIEPGSEQLLDQIAQALAGNTQVQKLRIEGHTDNVGDDTMNQQLSQQRAEAVKAALTKRGVSGDRLDAVGVGEERPIAPNDSAGGRQKNRRVEFVILGGS